MIAFFLLLPFAAAGVLLLRRRGEVTWILLAPFIIVAVTALTTYGNLRFREPAEVALVVLAGMALDQLLRRRAAPSAIGRGDPLRRPRHAAAGAHPVDPQAAGRDRRRADPLARDPDIRGPGPAPLLARTGYKGELIEEYVASRDWPEGVEVRCVDTGEDTPTGGRIRKLGELLGDRAFCATYADGVADIDISALIEFHRSHGDLATVTVVRPELQFGIAELDGDGRVRRLPARSRAASIG